ncbi:MAG: choice-of-anchor D domain-containing protein [Eubacteriales bacterium]|nr:choice-of-anchor D domain-containing protein [Eubacteriales bacterium]
MRKNRVLAIVMAVLMVMTLIPSVVFASAAPSGALDGTLKIKGSAAVGTTLSADYSKVKPEGITDDLVDFSWSLKDGDLLTEVSTDKNYKIDESAVGLPIVLKITGKEDKGISGSLTAATYEVSETEEEAKALAARKKEEAKDSGKTEIAADSEDSSEETGTDSQDTTVVEVNGNSEEGENTEAEADSTEEEKTQDTENVSETDSAETNTDAAETDKNNEQQENEQSSQEFSYSAEITTEDGSGILDFGSAEEGYTVIPDAQYVSIKNTGTGELNFKSMSPDHFMVADINDQPLKAGETTAAWVVPREGLSVGEYKDTITYETEEGVNISFEADFTVKEAQNTDPGEIPDSGKDQEKTYKLSVADDNSELTFDTLTEGYEELETRTVTICNDGSETVTLVQPTADHFDVTPVTSVETEGNIQLASGEEQMFTIQPKKDLSAQSDSYEDEIVFAAEEDEAARATVTARVSVKEAVKEEPSVSVDPAEWDFGSLEQGYDTAPEAKTITVTNTGTVAVRLAQPTAINYEVGTITSEVINPDESASFTVQPKNGLSADQYNGRISVKDIDGNTLTSVSVSFAVTEPQPVYDLSISPESLEFGTSEEGYKNAPAVQTVTVTNTGNTSITLKQPGSDYYIIGELSASELSAGSSATFTVQPKNGLTQGEYLEDISVFNSGNVSCYVNAHFSVSKKTVTANNLTGIKKPSDIKDLPNGTEKSQKALKLPSTVKITTTKGETKASVKWDVKGCSYNPSSADRQIFNVKGTVTLPDGVKNPDNISTVIAVSVTVKAYKGTQAKETENKITGIDANGKYDTNSKITFTAVGAGMDNESPKKGDTRYLPGSWKITETRTWDAAPYTATFRVSKAGQYTLAVTFKQQKYNGSKWENTGSESSKKVTFNVSQAASVTATITPNPSVTGTNKKSAVQTGDSTPIVPFAIILVAAAACIGGILVYRKNKK